MNALEIFKQLCINRYFELEVAKAHQNKYINIPIYLSVGQDHIPAIVSQVYNNWYVFPQHRCHSWCLSWGMEPIKIAKELLGRRDGCNNGMGGSASLASEEKKIFGHSGLLGDQIPIATGYAQASGQKTICVLGDAAAEEDYALGSFGYAITHKVPILFICEDNNLSILTEKKTRRSWDLVKIARSFGMQASHFYSYNITSIHKLHNYLLNVELPALINVNVQRHLWHAGSGKDYIPDYDVLYILKQELIKHYQQEKIDELEKHIEKKMVKLWQRLLT